jgi:hypothetical protein
MRNKILTLIFSLFLMTSVSAHHNTEFVEIIPTKFVSTNVVFVIDGSSTIRNSRGLKGKFFRAWSNITKKLASDEWYFSAYLFSDKGKEKYYDWRPAGGINKGPKELAKLYRWIIGNKQVRSYGNKAMSMAIKNKNHLNKNQMMARTLTVILITDGGFTEATRSARYKPCYEAIVKAQAWRKANELFEATILTIGLENKIYWSRDVKRPDSECQEFLKKVGKKYNGGYYLVRDKKK